MLSQPKAINLTSTEDGIHLGGSILWLDSNTTKDLSFLSAPHLEIRSLPTQILASEETLKILNALNRKAKGLLCRFNQKFSIGRLHLELLPSGVGLEGSTLYIESDSQKISYASEIQVDRMDVSRQLQVRKSDHLILGANAPYKAGLPVGQRKKLVTSLKEKLESLSSEKLFDFCEVNPTAQEVNAILNQSGMVPKVDTTIKKISDIYGSYGIDVTSRKHPTQLNQGVSILPLAKMKKFLGKNPSLESRVLAVASHPNDYNDLIHRWGDRLNIFYLPSHSYGIELKDYVQQVAPNYLYLFGPYAKEYAEQFSSLAPYVEPIFPKHLRPLL